MGCRRKTKIILNGSTIHTQFEGDVQCELILDAIDEWCKLLKKHPAIHYLIFDYTNASMKLLTTADAKRVADKTGVLVDLRLDIKLIGVIPEGDDYKITSIWSAFAATNESSVNFDNIIIFSTLQGALGIIPQ